MMSAAAPMTAQSGERVASHTPKGDRQAPPKTSRHTELRQARLVANMGNRARNRRRDNREQRGGRAHERVHSIAELERRHEQHAAADAEQSCQNADRKTDDQRHEEQRNHRFHDASPPYPDGSGWSCRRRCSCAARVRAPGHSRGPRVLRGRQQPRLRRPPAATFAAKPGRPSGRSRPPQPPGEPRPPHPGRAAWPTHQRLGGAAGRFPNDSWPRARRTGTQKYFAQLASA